MQKKAIRSRRIGIFFACLSSFAALCSVLFYLLVFSNVSPFAYLRGLWIETAMSTWHHHWLAESFFPGDKIAEVLDAINKTQDVIGGEDALKPTDSDTTTQPPNKVVDDDILDQKSLVVGGKDYAGNKVLINDIEEGLVVSEIVGATFKGKIMLIDDPARVYVGQTPYPDEKGLRIRAMMEHHGAIAGINASGFNDPYESGDGGTVVGLSCSNGEYWGDFTYDYGSIVLTADNTLVVGNISVWRNYNIRDGVQFGPVLIADGEAQVSGSAGYGIHPRTAIGQREDGVIAFLIIDGRDVSHSIGCTVGDLVDILKAYDIVNAACCDGGASSVLAYRGEVITKNCSLNPAYGRPLPNTFLVRPKSEMEEINGAE